MGIINEEVFIYKIVCPLSNECFYVGQTSQPEIRFKAHFGKQSRTHNRLKEITDKGLKPIFIIIEKCDYYYSSSREAYWIDKLKKEGSNLLNYNRTKNLKFQIINETQTKTN